MIQSFELKANHQHYFSISAAHVEIAFKMSLQMDFEQVVVAYTVVAAVLVAVPAVSFASAHPAEIPSFAMQIWQPMILLPFY